MKLTVLKPFRDKYTNEAYKAGDEIEVEDKRGEELLSAKGELVKPAGGGEESKEESKRPKTRRSKN